MSLLDGKKIANLSDDNYISKIEYLKQNNITPCIAIILANNNKESQTYVEMKKKKCDKLGIGILILKMDENIEEKDIIEQIQNFNKDKNINAILVQLPLPKHINKINIISSIDPKKDVDGFHYSNIGKLALGIDSVNKPCTPEGCIYLLDKYNIDIKGKHIVIIGKSHIVGLPLALQLLNRDATVTVCHIHTENIKEKTRQADILCVACGVPQLVKEDWIKENVVVIDVGINKLEDSDRKKGYRLVGDVDFEKCRSKCSFITPVPGGIGPMTVSMLINNIINCCYEQNNL